MTNPELSEYVKQQLASGVIPGSIRASLIAAGWNAALAEQAIKEQISQAAPQPPIPKPASGQPVKKRGLPIAVIFILIILGAGGGYAAYLMNKEVPPAPTGEDNIKGDNNAAPALEFSDAGLKFNYDATWKAVGMNGFAEAISSGDINGYTGPVEPETEYLFFSPDGWRKTNSMMSEFVAGDFFALFNAVYSQPEVRTSRISQMKAEDAVNEATRTVCSGTSVGYSTDNPIDKSRVRTVSVLGKNNQGYLLLPNAGCESGLADSVVLYVDAGTDAVAIIFNGASSLDELTPAQQAVFNSLSVQ